MCAHMYVSVLFFLFSICFWLFNTSHIAVRVCEWTCLHVPFRKSPQESPPLPRGFSDIWLQMDSLYLQAICPVKPLGVAAVCTSLQPSSGFTWNLAETLSFGSEGYKYAVYPFILLPPQFVSHLLQISLQCVFRELSLSPSGTDSKPRRF